MHEHIFRVALSMLFAFLAGCSPSAANEEQAMRAVYENPAQNFEMVIEISADGSLLRGETQGQDLWLLRREGVNYFIVGAGPEAQVMDTRVASELMAEVMPDELRNIAKNAPPIEFRPTGKTTVNGREGTGYVFASAPAGSEPAFVFSDDPSLGLLGKAMRQQFEASIRLNPAAGVMADPMLALFDHGAPLRFGGADLSDYEPIEFDSDRFELPNEPLDKDETRALMISRGMIPAEKIQLPDFAE